MIAIAIGHLINDTVQNIAPAMFPYLARDLGFTFTQLGLISFVLNMVSSTLQPIIGFISDKKPIAYALPIGMMSVFIGLSMFAFANQYYILLILCHLFRIWFSHFPSGRLSRFIYVCRQ